ncbi:hypothetical protein CUMW_264840 [Citrus unshiu]|uniref:MULE transposase domain-containing protein n=1 Tax=Citrus unshiu TaxID=55188 RepID=A0A2H5QV71_CITUN|nr:hypothetical protein CUMW_264840 [Citrus unshiu]
MAPKMLYKSSVILTKALLALVEFKYWREAELKGYRDPEEYKIIRLFHEILEVMVKYGHNEMDLIEIFVVLPWTTSVSMGSDKFEKLSEDDFIGGHSSDEENGLSQMYESIVDNEWKPNLNGSVSLKVGNTFESVALLREVMVKVDRPLLNSPVFQRFFLSFPALKVGYLIGCTPFIGLDRCHLKGSYRRVLLSVVALDADSGIFPLAFCICEVENYDSWGCFLSLLYEFIGADDHRSVTIISDRQKGLLWGLENYWPNASTRYCARHIFANLKCKFHGLNVMGLFWKACRAANQYDFERTMSQIRAKDQNCYEWLRKIPPAQWSRSGFDYYMKSDHVTNNMTESFNKWVDEVRDKPVLTILEHIRRQLMVRMLKKYQLSETWQDHLTPYGRERLNQSSNEARRIKAPNGRPKKKRTKEPSETKLTSKRFTIKCSACRCLGHKKRGCPNFPKTTRTIEGSNRTSSSAQASNITSSTTQQQQEATEEAGHLPTKYEAPAKMETMPVTSSFQDGNLINSFNQKGVSSDQAIPRSRSKRRLLRTAASQ